MTSLAAYLMRRNPRMSESSAEALGRRIIVQKIERDAKRRAEIEKAQIPLPLDSGNPPEPFVPDEPINF